jgi:lysine-N-methylase
MTVGIPLPVLMPVLPDQRWSCHSCGDCCRVLVGHLTAEDRARIDEQNWGQRLDVAPYVRSAGRYMLNKRDDGACVFLSEDNRCRIHAEFGEEAKPVACRIFPFSLRAVEGAWQASLRFDCPSVTSSKGAPLRDHRHWVESLAVAIDHQITPLSSRALLDARTLADPEELDALRTHLVRHLRDPERPLRRRIIELARLTTTLAGLRFGRVRGERFRDLLNVLFASPEIDFTRDPAPPTFRQEGMLRQLAFAHAEHVTLAELRSGVLGRLRLRMDQLGRARRFLRGDGEIPPLPGFPGGLRFDTVERLAWSAEDVKAIESLTLRYLIARLEGRSVWGAGYYHWPVFPGLTALWLSTAAAGWLARYVAAARGHEAVRFDDAAAALGIVDRAATRLPSLGTRAERARAAYLREDDGVAAVVGKLA